MPAETRLSIRQRLFDAVKIRFEGINQARGFATDVGTHCSSWRDLEKHPWAGAELAGAINVSDPERDPGDGVLTAHDQILTIDVSACGTGAPPDNHARRIEADILASIGQDRQWDVNGVKLAKDTLPGRSTIGVGHFGDRVSWVNLRFTILFRTARFDPYTQ